MIRGSDDDCTEIRRGRRSSRHNPPTEPIKSLRIGKGDSLYVIETNKGIELTPYNLEFASQMEAAERVMRRGRHALRKLAE